jgi:hypothetical protein
MSTENASQAVTTVSMSAAEFQTKKAEFEALQAKLKAFKAEEKALKAQEKAMKEAQKAEEAKQEIAVFLAEGTELQINVRATNGKLFNGSKYRTLKNEILLKLVQGILAQELGAILDSEKAASETESNASETDSNASEVTESEIVA